MKSIKKISMLTMAVVSFSSYALIHASIQPTPAETAPTSMPPLTAAAIPDVTPTASSSPGALTIPESTVSHTVPSTPTSSVLPSDQSTQNISNTGHPMSSSLGPTPIIHDSHTQEPTALSANLPTEQNAILPQHAVVADPTEPSINSMALPTSSQGEHTTPQSVAIANAVNAQASIATPPTTSIIPLEEKQDKNQVDAKATQPDNQNIKIVKVYPVYDTLRSFFGEIKKSGISIINYIHAWANKKLEDQNNNVK